MRIPVATYRLQINADFPLPAAHALVDYLHALGITDIYLSPIFEAVPGSTHGYDVIDPTCVGGEVGGRPALKALSRRARELDMGILLDIVPNHMAASELSPWWRDVLRHGRGSPFADYFDIDWATDETPGRLLLPVLAAPLEELLETAAIRAVEEGGEWSIELPGRRLPLALEQSRAGVLDEYRGASPTRRRELLRELLEQQHYRLVPWQTAAERLGYRRFFDITDLAGVCVERAEVFDATHGLVLDLLRTGEVTGLRIDHVDGLRDPTGYLARLRSEAGAYTVVEKILQFDEPLPPWAVEGTTGYDFLNLVNGLFIEGSGYARIGRAYLRLTGEAKSFRQIVREKKLQVMDVLFGGERAALTRLLRPLLGADFDAAATEQTLTELTAALPVYRTYARAGEQLSVRDREVLEIAFEELGRHHADLADAVVPRLRRVLSLEDEQTRDAGLEFLAGWQQFTGPVMAKGFEDTALYVYTAFIAACEVGGDPARACVSVADFHTRMQARAEYWPHTMNATATHDTKRGEDARARLNVLSELGEEWPRVLRAWASRSEEHKEEAALTAGLAGDEVPVPNAREESLLYQTLLGAWPVAGDADASFIERIKQYMVKALREGKESTSWHEPDQDFESFLAAFVDTLLAEPWWPGLREEIRAYSEKLAWHGALNSLAQTLLKITCPGVPDFYQGTELWSLSLVDPDNRQPVDFELRRAMLAELSPLLDQPTAGGVRALLSQWRSGGIKLYLTAAALRFRREQASLYERGAYLPLRVRGPAVEHLLAFARTAGEHTAITVAPRLLTRLCPPDEMPGPGAWGDTVIDLPAELQGRAWRNVLTGERHPAGESLRASEILKDLPLALLG